MKSTATEVKQKINAHILSYFEPENYGSDAPAIENLRDQMKSFDYMPTAYAGGHYMASGGTFLIYTQDMADFLNGLGINAEGREYPDHKIFERYCHLIGRQVAELMEQK
jgi:hypothetical protein